MADRSINMALEWGGLAITCGCHGDRSSRGRRGGCEVHCSLYLSFMQLVESLKNKNQLVATYYFIVLLIGSTCFGHYYAHHQELANVTTNVVIIIVASS